MKRVVVTGMGIVSSIGKEVLASLQQLKSGIKHNPVYAEMGLRSQVEGSINIDTKAHIHIKRLIMRQLILGIADATASVDGREIYNGTDLKVGLFTSTNQF